MNQLPYEDLKIKE